MIKLTIELPNEAEKMIVDLQKWKTKPVEREYKIPSVNEIFFIALEELWTGCKREDKRDVEKHKEVQIREKKRRIEPRDRLLQAKLITDLRAYRIALMNPNRKIGIAEIRENMKDRIRQIKENNPNIVLNLEEFIQTGIIKTKKGNIL